MIELKTLKRHEQNPRKYNALDLNRLKKSIEDFEKMMVIRPIIVDEGNTILGGHMKLSALEELGYTEIPDEWVTSIEDLTEDEKKEFLIKDNTHYGKFDYEMIFDVADGETLEEYGVSIMDMGAFDGGINEKETWGQLPEFRKYSQEEFKITLIFKTEEDRAKYIEEHEVKIDSNMSNQFTSKF